MKVLLKDVARVAGVSASTASLALNDKPSISSNTKEKVLLAAKKLNYRPHIIAKQLALGRTNSVICFVIPSQKTTNIVPSSWGFYYLIIQGIQDILSAHNYRFLLEIRTMENIEREKTLLNFARESSVEGAFFLLQVKDDYGDIFKLKSMGFPIVVINANIWEQVSSVCVDYINVAQRVMEYLILLGHQKVAFISGSLNYFSALEILPAFKEIVYESRLKVKKQWIVEGDWTIDSGYECAGRILEVGMPTAIFCGNDHMAAGAMRRIKETGLLIPEDISVMGFDDSAIAKVTIPPLSSVRQPLYRIGELAGKELIRLMGEKQIDARKILLETEIVKRQSCRAIK